MNPRRVVELWSSFWAAVAPADAPPDQLREMRRAFNELVKAGKA